ncbi:MAG: Glu/Leu/Phe/Val dehydrogenase, partial [Chromatiales bacterium]|nr:Glu/Leu/Phe/Val dehydrogenase [Chromatiales bacterium]
MSLFQSPAFDAHEQVAFCHDRQSGLNAIIAIHDTTRGPSLGGCRMWPYADEQTALTDVLRLSRGMTYKSAVAGLALGGGKSVIFGDPRKDKTPQLMEAMGTCVENLGGRYFVAEDSGTSVADIQMMATRTAYVAGATDKLDELGQPRSGDPSPATAQGVFYGIQAAVAHRLGRNDLDGVSVAIQGMGNVGRVLAQRLHEAGACLYVADLHSSNCADA